jgi:hypothetical protein
LIILILSNPISGLLPKFYSYLVYMQYNIIWHVNAGRSQRCWLIIVCNDSSSSVSNQVWSENTAVQIYFKIIFIFDLGSYFWRKKNKSQKTVPRSADEDRGVALLRRQHVCLGISACICEVRIGLNLREWIRVDYITYY